MLHRESDAASPRRDSRALGLQFTTVHLLLTTLCLGMLFALFRLLGSGAVAVLWLASPWVIAALIDRVPRTRWGGRAATIVVTILICFLLGTPLLVLAIPLFDLLFDLRLY